MDRFNGGFLMKKMLSMMLAVALIIVPTYQYGADNGFVIPDSRPMGLLAKVATLGAMAGFTIAGTKAYNWYEHKDAHDILNEKYPGHEGVVPEDRGIVLAQWKLDKYPTVGDLWNNKDEVLKELQELRPGKHIPELGTYHWSYIAKVIKDELRAATAVRDSLSRYTTYDKKTDKTLASMNQQQLNDYYAAIKIKEAAKAADVVLPGSFEWSSAYAYAVGKGKQLAAWIMRKPTITEETKNRFVAVLKGYHRLEILNAIVDRATEAEIEKQTPKKETPVVAPVVQEAPQQRAGLFDDLYKQMKNNPALATIAGMGLFTATLFVADSLFN